MFLLLLLNVRSCSCAAAGATTGVPVDGGYPGDNDEEELLLLVVLDTEPLVVDVRNVVRGPKSKVVELSMPTINQSMTYIQ